MNTQASAPYNITCAPRQRNMAQMKEQIKAPEKELSNDEMANLSDAEFKTLVIRVLTEMTEYRCKIEEEVKAIQSEIKKKYTGKQQWREGNWDSNQRFGAEGRNKYSTGTEWGNKNSKKNEEKLRNLQDNFKHPNIRIIGVPEGKEEEQEIENLFEKVMKENFPNLAMQIDFREVQEAQRVPKTCKEAHTKAHHYYITQD